MPNYLNVAFSTLKAPMTNHRTPLSGSIYAAVARIADGLKALVDAIADLRGPPVIEDKL